MAVFNDEIRVTALGPVMLFGMMPLWNAWIILGGLALAALALIAVGLVRKRIREKQKKPLQQFIENEAAVQAPDTRENLSDPSSQQPNADSQIPEAPSGHEPEAIEESDCEPDGRMTPEENTKPQK